MSGIAGICDFDENIDKKILRDMINIIGHRGNDGLSVCVDDKIAMAHCLLDIKGEKTKRPIRNESGSILAILDGLIYNYSELRANLEKKGHKFYSNAEEEVIVHLYEEHGTDSIKMIDGEFAFVLWNSDKKELLLAIDSMGAKPLFYTLVDKKLLFGSELKSLLIYDVKKEIDLESFYKYFNCQGLPEFSTLIKGIKKLPPAHLMVYNEMGIEFFKYWDISFKPEIRLSEEHIIEHLSKLLRESVSKRIKTNDYAIALSGGIDSITILELINSITEGEINTYTVDFDRPSSEFSVARELSNYFNTKHHELVLEAKHFYLTPKAIWHADLGKRIPQVSFFDYMLANLSNDKKILFYGYGSEQAFCSNLFSSVKKTIFLRKIPYAIRKNLSFLATMFPKSMRPFIFSRHEGEIFGGSPWGLYFLEREMKNIFTYSYKTSCISINRKDSMENFIYNMFRVQSFSELYLTNVESAAFSQEATSPFADRELVNFVCKIPLTIRMKGDKSKKYLLKKYIESKNLPNNLLPKGKISPVLIDLSTIWIKEHKDLFQHFLLKLCDRQYFKKDSIMKLLRNVEDNESRLWLLWEFELWHEIFIDRKKIKEPKTLKEFL